MATAIAAGSILSSGASAAAGAGLIGATGIAGVSFGTISAGFGIAGQALSFLQGRQESDRAFEATIAASRAELAATRARVAEGERQQQQEKTQLAIEEAERQRRARRLLASQRASFAGGFADIFSGSPMAIQEATAGEINRESRLAEQAGAGRVNILAAQTTGVRAAGLGKAASLINQGLANKEVSRLSQAQQLTKIGQSVGKLTELL